MPSPDAQSNPSAPPFAIQPEQRLHQPSVCGAWAPDQVGICLHAGRDPIAAFQLRESCERVRHSLEGKGEGEDAAAVDPRAELVLGNLGRLGVDGEHLPLHAVAFEPVALAAPAFRATEREHPGVLPGAVVLEPRRRLTLRPALELLLARRHFGQQRAHGRELRNVGKVGRRRDRKIALVEIGPGTRRGDRLKRLRRGAHECDQARVACLCDHGSVLHRNGVHEVDRLGHAPSTHGYPDRIDALEPKGQLSA